MQNEVEFNYDVKITADAGIIRSGPLAETLNNCGEMIITSKPYTDYVECEKTFTELLSTLSFIEAKITSKELAIFNAVNPLSNGTDWDRHIIMRSYVAGVDTLKSSLIANCSIHGQIRANQAVAQLIP